MPHCWVVFKLWGIVVLGIMRLVGLTGGIATGKSTVSKLLVLEGIRVVDCDRIAHDAAKKVRCMIGN